MTVAHVAFRNAGSLPQAGLEAVAGMHPGEHVTLAQIRAAATLLSQSGYSDGVSVDSSGAPGALTVIYILKPVPADQLLPVGFENFVWLTPDEVRAAVRRADPLFAGELPLASTRLDAVGEALKAALAAKGVTHAEVVREEVLPTTAEPVHAFQFRVVTPSVVVGRVELSAEGSLLPEVGVTAAKLHGAPYTAGYAKVTTEQLLLRPYLNAGYLDARLADVKLAAQPEASDQVPVDVSARVAAGEPYHVGAITFVGSPLVSQEAFAAGAKLHPGDVASRKQLMATLAPVDAAYTRQGYMDEYVDTVATEDPGSHSVNYTLKVVPGEQYRLGKLIVLNLRPEAQAQFDLAWAMKPGEVYNAEYVSTFLTSNTAMRSLAGYTGSFSAASNPQTHLVELTVKFFPVGGRQAR